MKKCIVYIPYELVEHGMGARMVRPRKMIEAFRNIGYDVYVIDGFSENRKKLIKTIKNQICSGVIYDFMYVESSTEPMLLTVPHHLPTYPFLDFGFFRFIKAHSIPIGLFYCDIYWKFDTYGNDLPAWKRIGGLLNYQYDIKQYKKYLSKFYVPNLQTMRYLGEDELTKIAAELPPGADDLIVNKSSYACRDFSEKPLTVFYVGGIGNHYQILELVKAIYRTDCCRLILCCRKNEWEREKNLFSEYLSEKITIIHETTDRLEPYYAEADLCSLLFRIDEYTKMAIPFKSFEYIAHETPVICTKGTAMGDFIEKYDCGWTIPFDVNSISNVLCEIIKSPGILKEKEGKCIIAKGNNLWTTRATQVASDLINYH